MDGGWTVGGRWVDGGWTVGGRWVDSGWTLGGLWVDGTKKNGNGRWTGWSRKVDGMVTEGGWDGHGRWTGWSRKVDGKRSKTKDLLYLNIYHLQNLVPISDIF